MKPKFLIAIRDNDVAARLDQCLEVLIVQLDDKGRPLSRKNLVLAKPSDKEICRIAQAEGVGAVICGAVDEEISLYLTWKSVQVIDDVIGPVEGVLRLHAQGRLTRSTIIPDETAKRMVQNVSNETF
ncbi:dinitrogenase iron-molybdenum cofactor biosynthesis protein [Desulfovibrio aminophilus]|uniref:dinitrogenase iron-molybdenum cofactor biosynthesis protein n=1 Tax=Desulfovibrio aminophilus TaxID=81425 RepID=UPI00042035D0|nr:dinitrogenase iron-molybdenum cofactor biosynthesis protein [Desulfovibrio aminophilus]